MRNISKALKTFGLKDDSTYVLAVVMTPTSQKVDAVRAAIIGSEVSDIAENISRCGDEKLARYHYSIDVNEGSNSTLVDSIVTRIACRDAI